MVLEIVSYVLGVCLVSLMSKRLPHTFKIVTIVQMY